MVGERTSGGHEVVTSERPNIAGKKYRKVDLGGLPNLQQWRPASHSELAVTGTGALVVFKKAFFVQAREVKPQTVLNGVAALDVSANAGCAVQAKNQLLCYVGNPPTLTKDDFKLVEGVKPAKDVSVDGRTVAIIQHDGAVSTFKPSSSFGPRPRRIAGVTAAQAVALGKLGDAGCAVTGAGKLRCWGRRLELGLYAVATMTDARDTSDIPSFLMGGIRDAKQVAFGDGHACALHASGEVSCWGDNSFDQVGAASPPFSAKPVRIQL